jgi:DNA-binding MarR family transcriptional regulator
MQSKVDKVNQSPAAGEVIEAMHAIMHLFRSARQRSLRDGAHELAHMEAKALGYFARHPGATQSDLVAHAGRDKAQVARLIRTLRERGLLDATPDAQDRRITRLALTEAGQAMHTELHRDDGRLADAALAGIGPDERAVLFALLGKVRANLAVQGD